MTQFGYHRQALEVGGHSEWKGLVQMRRWVVGAVWREAIVNPSSQDSLLYQPPPPVPMGDRDRLRLL